MALPFYFSENIISSLINEVEPEFRNYPESAEVKGIPYECADSRSFTITVPHRVLYDSDTDHIAAGTDEVSV